MIPVRKNIDTDELVFWLDTDSHLCTSSTGSVFTNSIFGKQLLAGTSSFTNTPNGLIGSTTYANENAYGPGPNTPINLTISASGTPAPDSSGNATHIFTESLDTSNKTHYLRFDIGLTPPSTGAPYEVYTHSLYVKVSSGSRTIRIVNSNNQNAGALTVDPATGTIVASDADNIDEGVESLGGGWYRIFYTVEINKSFDVESRTEVEIYLADAAGNTSYQGDGTSSIIVYGHQWERGVLSNYTQGPEANEFNILANKKLRDNFLTDNPQLYSTTFDGTNLRFNGLEVGLLGSSYKFSPFRSGTHPNGIDPRFSILSHTVFAWIKMDTSGDPEAGVGWGKCATIFGNIGGRKNNGVFGMRPDGTRIVYKTRIQPNSGSAFTFENESSAFPTKNDTWALIACSVNMNYGASSATLDFYLDGVYLNSKTIFNSVTKTILGISGGNDSLHVGNFVVTPPGNTNTYRGLYRGLLNTCGIYNKSLNAAEHEELYNATKYRFHNN